MNIPQTLSFCFKNIILGMMNDIPKMLGYIVATNPILLQFSIIASSIHAKSLTTPIKLDEGVLNFMNNNFILSKKDASVIPDPSRHPDEAPVLTPMKIPTEIKNHNMLCDNIKSTFAYFQQHNVKVTLSNFSPIAQLFTVKSPENTMTLLDTTELSSYLSGMSAICNAPSAISQNYTYLNHYFCDQLERFQNSTKQLQNSLYDIHDASGSILHKPHLWFSSELDKTEELCKLLGYNKTFELVNYL